MGRVTAPGAADTLRSYVRRLRQALRGHACRIATRGSGYLITVQQPELDTLEFESLWQDTRTAVRAQEWAGAFEAATRALGLWQATPLLDVSAEALRREFVPRFERLRLQLQEDRFDAGLRLGQHHELIPELLDMTARHPLQERFRAQLMLALAGVGQRAQALDVYRETRRLLIGELGIEPGSQLRDIHRQILADGMQGTDTDEIPPGRAAGTSANGTPADPGQSARPCLAQLPADIADFTGREAEIRYMRNALTCRAAADTCGTVRVVVVTGAAGLGKSALAVHVAHQLRSHFPDGQLYAHLSGASARPAEPGEVLSRFLRDLGVHCDSVPVGEEERAALYRTLLTGRRVLILLDDAKDAAQIRPLLPGSASCAVVVTARNRAPYLVSTGFIDLNTLPAAEALELFARIVGYDRAVAEPDAAAQILAACAGLPPCDQDLRRAPRNARPVEDRHDGSPVAGRTAPAR